MQRPTKTLEENCDAGINTLGVEDRRRPSRCHGVFSQVTGATHEILKEVQKEMI